MVTASHNPADYNGLKLVREQARPISGDTGLAEIARMAESPVPRGAGGPETSLEGTQVLAPALAWFCGRLADRPSEGGPELR